MRKRFMGFWGYAASLICTILISVIGVPVIRGIENESLKFLAILILLCLVTVPALYIMCRWVYEINKIREERYEQAKKNRYRPFLGW